MNKAEKKAVQDDLHKQRFINGFRQLHASGHSVVTLADVKPLAAAQDDAYMRKRDCMTLMLTGHRAQELPHDVNYPSKKGAERILEQLLEEGLVETRRNFITDYDTPYSRDASTDQLYCLAPAQPPADVLPDVAITT